MKLALHAALANNRSRTTARRRKKRRWRWRLKTWRQSRHPSLDRAFCRRGQTEASGQAKAQNSQNKCQEAQQQRSESTASRRTQMAGGSDLGPATAAPERVADCPSSRRVGQDVGNGALAAGRQGPFGCADARVPSARHARGKLEAAWPGEGQTRARAEETS